MRVTVILMTAILADPIQSGTAVTQAVVNVYGDTGTFLSPGYPQQYSNNLNVKYTAHLNSSGPLVVRLNMELDLEYWTPFCYDYVNISSQVYCGNRSLVSEVQVSGNVLSMIFISDVSYTYRGFNITYTVLQATMTVAEESTSMATGKPVKLLFPVFMETSHSEESSTLTSEVTHIELTSDRNLGIEKVILTPVTDPTGVQSSDVSSGKSLASRVTSAALMTPQAAVSITSVKSSSTSSPSITKVSNPPGTESFTSAVTPLDSGLPQNVTSGSSPAPAPVLVACRCKSWNKQTPGVAVQQAEAQALLLATELAVDRSNVSSLKRRKTSASDRRVSSATFGVMITAICVVPFLFLVVTDIAVICTQTKCQRNKRDITA